ncbi:uncharacterized protein [Chanodichthys erythropterus]|uniref:uncharacterized protein isoform X2 n=1 Tax=Chanodichthys erythropterus TaxID=933992 RepID=UPI00351DEC35
MIVLFNFVYRKIRPPICVLMSILLMITDGFTVRGPSGPLVVSLGSSVVLPCYVDKALSSEGLEVEWRRTDSETLVHLYQDGKSRPGAQEQEYHDRAHFFTDQIQHGNFSLRLDNLRAEDEGKYTCKVYSQQDSGETVVTLKNAERLLVSGSSHSVSASVGEDVTLNCSVDSHIKPEHFEEVLWKKTDEDEDILVLLYQNNETFPGSSDERYRDRVEFFTDEIPKGNFSLRLKSVRAEDKGVYMCQVFAGGLSANATVVLERLGFSALQIMVLILCVSGSGSALLLCCMIYCRTQNGFTVTYSQDTLVDLGSSVVLRCYSVKPLQVEDLKVEWRRTDTKALVHLYQDGESRPEKQHEDYHDRAHFFTDQIQHGNFSLRLDNLRAEDEGKYTCKVYRQKKCVFSTQITLEKVVSKIFKVKVSSAPLVFPLGSSVVLPCYCDKRLPSEGLKVEWRRTDSDSETLVHLYPDRESRPEEKHKDYHNRAHFFTDQIQHGNFSLRLDNLRAEDEGKYTCKVYSEQRSVFSTKANLEPRLLDSFLRLHLSLVVCPNMIMFFAFVFWGVSEGSVNETVCCCALYFLRPLLILWAAPYINKFAALFSTAWQKLLNFAVFDRVVIIVLFSVVFLCCFCKIIYLLVTEIGKKKGRIIEIFGLVADMISDILPTLQFVLLFYTFGSAGAGFIIIVILPVFMMMTNDRWFARCYYRLDCSRSVIRTVMMIFTLVMNAVMIGFYIMTLEKTTDPIGWGCVLVLLQILWTVMKFTEGYYFSFDEDFHRFVPMYVFGSAGFILLTSTALITELILKTVNGDRTVGDLRFIVFPVECFFAVSVLISGLFASQIKNRLQSCQAAVRSRRDRRSQQKQKTEETQEMKRLKTEDQEEMA